MWDLPRPGIEHISAALAGGVSTTEPPGKSQNVSLGSCRGLFLSYPGHKGVFCPLVPEVDVSHQRAVASAGLNRYLNLYLNRYLY